MTASQRNPSLPLLDVNATWDCWSPEPWWSFLQICLHTVVSSNQQLHVFFSILTDCSNNSPSNPIGLRHVVLALAREGMRQSAITGRRGLTSATAYRIFRRHAATRTLVPGKSTGLLGRPHLIKTVLCWGWSDSIASQALGPYRCGWGICVELGLSGKLLTTSSSLVVTVVIYPKGSPCWPPTTAVTNWSGHRGGRTWHWSIASKSSSVTSPDSNFTQ